MVEFHNTGVVSTGNFLVTRGNYVFIIAVKNMTAKYPETAEIRSSSTLPRGLPSIPDNGDGIFCMHIFMAGVFLGQAVEAWRCHARHMASRASWRGQAIAGCNIFVASFTPHAALAHQ